MKKKIILIALALFVFTSCGNSPKTGPDAGKDTETVQKLNKKESLDQMEVKEDQKGLMSEMNKLIVGAIEEGAKDYCKVDSEVKDGIFIIHLYPINEFKEETKQVLSGEESQAVKEWKEMADQFQEASKSLSENLGQNLSIQIHNPEDEDKVIFSTSNDKITYNVLDELYPDENK